jgi:hypothetical protein
MLALRVLGRALGRLLARSAIFGIRLGGFGRTIGRRSDFISAFRRSFGGLTLVGRICLLGSRFLGRSLAGIGSLDDFLLAG